jgi:hypothetical protein
MCIGVGADVPSVVVAKDEDEFDDEEEEDEVEEVEEEEEEEAESVSPPRATIDPGT